MIVPRISELGAQWLLASLALCGCDHPAPLGFECPRPSVRCWASDSGAGANATIPTHRDAADSDTSTSQPRIEPLALTIIDADGEPISSVQLVCDRPCIELTANARGGVPPYAFSWSDANDAQTRTLCPDGPSRYTVEVRDSSKPDAGVAPVTATVDLDRASCAVDAGSVTATNACQRFAVGQYSACGNVGVGDVLPQLKTGKRYTLLAHSNLMSAGSLQLTGVGQLCTGSESLGSLTLPTGPATVAACLAPALDTSTLMLTTTSGGAAAFLTNLDSFVELCDGCD